MRAKGFTHVSIHAHDLEESARFYKDFFGMEEVPSPEFSSPVRWLRVGDLQLHLFLSEDPAPARHHFALGAGEGSGYFSKVYQLPDGAVQLYVRDPAGNLVEINWPDVTTLDRSVVPDIVKVPGKPDARLYQ